MKLIPARASDEVTELYPIVRLRAKRVAYQFAMIIALLVSLHVVVMLIYYDELFGFKTAYGLKYWQITIFDLDEEESFGTWFNAFILFYAAVLLWIHARAQEFRCDRWYRWWLILAVGFLLLSIDEIVGMHEYLNSALGDTSWTSVAVPGVAVLALVFVPFVLHLPLRSRILFVVAAIVYLGGALGVERWADRFVEQQLLDTLEYNLWTAVEETMEMSGVVLFVYALLAHMAGTPGHALEVSVRSLPTSAKSTK